MARKITKSPLQPLHFGRALLSKEVFVVQLHLTEAKREKFLIETVLPKLVIPRTLNTSLQIPLQRSDIEEPNTTQLNVDLSPLN